MAELTDTYVVHGACTQCSMGMRQSRVVLHETHGVFLKKQAQMTVKDCKGEYHVICFGGCYSMENPSTQEEAKKVQDKVKELSPDTFLDKVMGFFTGGKKKKEKEKENYVVLECSQCQKKEKKERSKGRRKKVKKR